MVDAARDERWVESRALGLSAALLRPLLANAASLRAGVAVVVPTSSAAESQLARPPQAAGAHAANSRGWKDTRRVCEIHPRSRHCVWK